MDQALVKFQYFLKFLTTVIT